MGNCAVCVEKQKEIDRILASYANDRKRNRKVQMIMGSLIVLMAAFGKDGITMFMDLVQKIIK